MGVVSNWVDREELKPGDHIYSWREAYLYAHHGIYVGDGTVIHFTRGGQEIGKGTILDRLCLSSSPTHSADNPCPKCGDQSKLNGVISSCLDCFLYGGHLYRFEYGVSAAFFLVKARGGTCTLAPADPPEDVLHRARYLLQNGFGAYNVFRNNCEDFAIYCKTGLLVITDISVGLSGQAASCMAAIPVVASSPLRFLTTKVSSTLPYLTTSLSATISFSGLAVVGCGMYCISRLRSDIGVRRDVAKVPVESFTINPDASDEPANSNEANRPIEPPGLDEKVKANKVTKEE